MPEAEKCEALSDIATTVMKARLDGVPLSYAMGARDIVAEGFEEFEELLESIVLLAYESPAYQTEAAQEHAIVEFSNQIYLWCFK